MIETDGHKSVVSFDREIAMCRSEFRGFSRVADFNDRDMKELESEGRISLEVHSEVCRETGMRPLRAFSVEFNMRLDPGLHQVAKIAAAADAESVSHWVAESKEAAASWVGGGDVRSARHESQIAAAAALNANQGKPTGPAGAASRRRTPRRPRPPKAQSVLSDGS